MANEDINTFGVPEDGLDRTVTFAAEMTEFHGSDVLIEVEHTADRSMTGNDFYNTVRPLLSDSNANGSAEELAGTVHEVMAQELETEDVFVLIRIKPERSATYWKTVQVGQPVSSTSSYDRLRPIR